MYAVWDGGIHCRSLYDVNFLSEFSKPRLPRVVALKIHLVYLGQ